jgi:hypothetical protein
MRAENSWYAISLSHRDADQLDFPQLTYALDQEAKEKDGVLQTLSDHLRRMAKTSVVAVKWISSL